MGAPASSKKQPPVAQPATCRRIARAKDSHLTLLHFLRLRPKRDRAVDDIYGRIECRVQGYRGLRTRLHLLVLQPDRRVGSDGRSHAERFTCDHRDVDLAIRTLGGQNFVGQQVLIARCRKFIAGRQIDPGLETVCDTARLVEFRPRNFEWTMPAPTSLGRSAVSCRSVIMQLLALQAEIRDADGRVRRAPLPGRVPFVEHQERIDLIQLRRHRPADEEAGPLALLVGDDALNIALVH